MFHVSNMRCRNNFQIFRSLTVNCDSVYQSQKWNVLKGAFGHREWVFNIYVEIPNLNFKEWKYSQDCSLKRVLITFLSKLMCGRVTLFHFVYWISVREWSKCILTSQQFWKLTNNGPKWCNFKINVTGCLPVVKHCLWQTSKDAFSSLLQFCYLHCCVITIFLWFSCIGLDVKLK